MWGRREVGRARGTGRGLSRWLGSVAFFPFWKKAGCADLILNVAVKGYFLRGVSRHLDDCPLQSCAAP